MWIITCSIFWVGMPSAEDSAQGPVPHTAVLSLLQDNSLCFTESLGVEVGCLDNKQLMSQLLLSLPWPLGNVTSESAPLPFSPGNLFGDSPYGNCLLSASFLECERKHFSIDLRSCLCWCWGCNPGPSACKVFPLWATAPAFEGVGQWWEENTVLSNPVSPNPSACSLR